MHTLSHDSSSRVMYVPCVMMLAGLLIYISAAVGYGYEGLRRLQPYNMPTHNTLSLTHTYSPVCASCLHVHAPCTGYLCLLLITTIFTLCVACRTSMLATLSSAHRCTTPVASTTWRLPRCCWVRVHSWSQQTARATHPCTMLQATAATSW